MVTITNMSFTCNVNTKMKNHNINNAYSNHGNSDSKNIHYISDSFDNNGSHRWLISVATFVQYFGSLSNILGLFVVGYTNGFV